MNIGDRVHIDNDWDVKEWTVIRVNKVTVTVTAQHNGKWVFASMRVKPYECTVTHIELNLCMKKSNGSFSVSCSNQKHYNSVRLRYLNRGYIQIPFTPHTKNTEDYPF